MQIGIGKLENRGKSLPFCNVQRREARVEKMLEDPVELAHAAPASPAQSSDRRIPGLVGQCCRSTISFLIAAIARPGFRSFGHA
jgi:hypothetical protein